MSPFMAAVRGGDPHVVRCMLRAGCDHKSILNQRAQYGATPLAAAARSGNLQVREAVLSLKASSSFEFDSIGS